MIFDTLANAESYRDQPELYRALMLLRQYGDALPAEGVQTEDGRIRLSALTIRTQPDDACRYEAHRRFIDVHCTLCGTELIRVQNVERLSALTSFDEEKDVGFYEGDAQSDCRVAAGWFLVCFPQDAHKVCVQDDAPGEVEKIVVKLAATEFSK